MRKSTQTGTKHADKNEAHRKEAQAKTRQAKTDSAVPPRVTAAGDWERSEKRSEKRETRDEEVRGRDGRHQSSVLN